MFERFSPSYNFRNTERDSINMESSSGPDIIKLICEVENTTTVWFSLAFGFCQKSKENFLRKMLFFPVFPICQSLKFFPREKTTDFFKFY